MPEKIPMNQLIVPKYSMGLTDLSLHLEEVASHYKPLDDKDRELSIEKYKEFLSHDSWIVVEGALYGLELMYYKHSAPWSEIKDAIEGLRFNHPSKVIRTIVKCMIRFNDRCVE